MYYSIKQKFSPKDLAGFKIMLCDICKKREATIHIKEVKDGKCISTNLCPECAKEKEMTGGLGAFGFNLAEVIFNVGKMSGAKKAEDPAAGKEKTPRVVCARCGWTLGKMRRSGGKLGCPECYKTFAKWVGMAIEQVQKSAVHTGKRPAGNIRSLSGIKLEIDKLQLELAGAVSAEEYEKAAQFRDRINQLKEELAGLGKKGEDK